MQNYLKWIIIIPLFVVINIISAFILNIIYKGVEFIYNNFIGGTETYIIDLEKYADDNITMIFFKSAFYAISFNISCTVTSELLFEGSKKSIIIVSVFSFLCSIIFLFLSNISYFEFFLYLIVLFGYIFEILKKQVSTEKHN
jgi:hypothetical protein